MVSDFSEIPGPDVVVMPSAPPNEAPSAAPMPAISSSAWKVRTPKRLVAGQLVQDVGRRGDRVRAEEDRQARALPGGDEPEGQRLVAGDVAVAARRHRRGLDLVADREGLGRLAVVEAGAERGDVGRGDRGLAAELSLEEAHRALGRPVVHPRQQAEREHVLRALGLLLAQTRVGERLEGEGGQRHAHQLPAVERAVLQGVLRVPDLGQVARGELVAVGDEQAAAGQVDDVRLERRGVHHDQHVRGVARRHDVVVGEVQLEGADAGEGARGGADLGGEVGQRRQVVAEGRRLAGEAVARQLHAVAGVTGQPDDHAVEFDHALHQAARGGGWREVRRRRRGAARHG